MTYALDTNAVIHLLRDNPAAWERYDAVMSDGNDAVIPPFVEYEIRRGFLYKPAPAKERAYDELCRHCPLGVMTTAAWRKAARIYADLRKEGFTIEDADILIAAFCVIGGHTLVMGNTKHFARIDGLKLVNWAETD